jgi:hypothetical protein
VINFKNNPDVRFLFNNKRVSPVKSENVKRTFSLFTREWGWGNSPYPNKQYVVIDFKNNSDECFLFNNKRKYPV